MKAKLILSLSVLVSSLVSLVVVTLVATTWFSKSEETTQPPTANSISIAPGNEVGIVEVNLSDRLDLEIQEPQQATPNHFADELSRAIEEPYTTPSITREQAIEQLQGKFRLLETQYGVLSVDDIQALEQSINEIDELDNIVDLSEALNTLIDQ